MFGADILEEKNRIQGSFNLKNSFLPNRRRRELKELSLSW